MRAAVPGATAAAPAAVVITAIAAPVLRLGFAGTLSFLAVWLTIGTLATIVVTDRRRYLSTKQLRHNALLPATA